eukprot:gene8624-4705_t
MPSGAIGQTASEQLNLLSDVEEVLGNADEGFFSVRNGYTRT